MDVPNGRSPYCSQSFSQLQAACNALLMRAGGCLKSQGISSKLESSEPSGPVALTAAALVSTFSFILRESQTGTKAAK